LKGPPAEKLGCQEEEVGSKRHRGIIVRGGPVEGEREEGQETTLTLHELKIQQLIAHDGNDLLPCPLFLLADSDTDTLIFPKFEKTLISQIKQVLPVRDFFSQLVCLFLVSVPRARSARLGVCGVEVFSRQLFRQ